LTTPTPGSPASSGLLTAPLLLLLPLFLPFLRPLSLLGLPASWPGARSATATAGAVAAAAAAAAAGAPGQAALTPHLLGRSPALPRREGPRRAERKGEESAGRPGIPLLVGTCCHWPTDARRSGEELNQGSAGCLPPHQRPVNGSGAAAAAIVVSSLAFTVTERGRYRFSPLLLFFQVDLCGNFQTCPYVERTIKGTPKGPEMQFRQFSAHSRTCFIYTLKILRDIVLEYLNQTPNIPLFLLLDVEMETQEVQKDCQWWRRDTSHSGVSLSGSLDREKPRRRAKEGADLHFLYQPLFTHEHTYRCARLEEEPGWPQTLTLSHPHLSPFPSPAHYGESTHTH